MLLAIFCLAVVSRASAQTFPSIEKFPEPTALPAQPGLPDPLVMMDGRKVESKEMWEKERRPELKRLFQHYMYGYMPGSPAKMEATVEREDTHYFGGKATKREVALKVGG